MGRRARRDAQSNLLSEGTVDKLAKLRTTSTTGEEFTFATFKRTFDSFEAVESFAEEEENTNLLTLCSFAKHISGGELRFGQSVRQITVHTHDFTG